MIIAILIFVIKLIEFAVNYRKMVEAFSKFGHTCGTIGDVINSCKTHQ